MSIMSMTGFGSATAEVEGRTFRVDIKSVNHKAFSARTHLPGELASLEPAIKSAARKRLHRGAVDIHISVESAAASQTEIVIDQPGIKQMMSALIDLAAHVGTPSPSLDLALRYGDYIHVRRTKMDAALIGNQLMPVVDQALTSLCEMRLAEGAALVVDLKTRLHALTEAVDVIEGAAPLVIAAQQKRLQQRLERAEQKMGMELDQARVATELVVFADRSDVTEETVRARVHLNRFIELLSSGASGEQGKRLDFLSQELLREFNTMGSKCRDANIANRVVESKVELEKVREQVQNIA